MEQRTEANFPFRGAAITPADARSMLARLVSTDPEITENTRGEYTLPPRAKIHTAFRRPRIPNLLDAKAATIVAPTADHWDLDSVMDVYTEASRVRSAGYGEVHSAMEFWTNPRLAKRWTDHANAKFDAREAISASIQEPRPAYTSATIGLYRILAGAHPEDAAILDISAYGERATAAVSIGARVYHGVDPDPSLCPGYARLTDDLAVAVPGYAERTSVSFSTIPLEDFRTQGCKFNILTLSPPPFTAERYESGSAGSQQSHARYPTFVDWFRGFLVEVACLAVENFLDGEATLAFTAFDRDSERYPPKSILAHAPRAQIPRREDLDITYVEAFVLVLYALGFRHTRSIGFATGGKKSAGTMWFAFTRPRGRDASGDARYLSALCEGYPALHAASAARLAACNPGGLSNAWLPPLYPDRISIPAEVRRGELMAHLVSEFPGVRPSAVQSALSRWIAARGARFPRELALDPLFPVNMCGDTAPENAEFEANMRFAGDPNARATFPTPREYYDVCYSSVGEYFDGCARLLSHLSATRQTGGFAVRLTDSRVVVKGDRGQIVLSEMTRARAILAKVHSGAYVQRHECAIAALQLRYAALGGRGHHFTRPVSRIEAVARFFGTTVSRAVDAFATYLNANTARYMSPFPDLEHRFGSLGSAFSAGIEAYAPFDLLLANPVDTPVFTAAAVDSVIVPFLALPGDRHVSAGFTVWDDASGGDFAARLTSGDVSRSGNAAMDRLVAHGISTARLAAVYILDQTRHGSFDPEAGRVVASAPRAGSMSVGVLLSNSDASFDLDAIADLAVDFHVFSAPRETYNGNTFPFKKFYFPAPARMFANLVADAREMPAWAHIRRSFPADADRADLVTEHFIEDIRIRCRFQSAPTPAEAFSKLRYRLARKSARDAREAVYAASKECNTFNPLIMVAVLAAAAAIRGDAAGGLKILDPSAGWGDRLVGAAVAHASGVARVARYLGVDPETALHPRYAAMVDAFGASETEYQFVARPFEDARMFIESYDVAFSSPPFFSLETYSDINAAQSTARYPTYSEWVTGFLRLYLKKMIRAVRRGTGVVGMYVSDYSADGETYPLAADTIRIASEIGGVERLPDITYLRTPGRVTRTVYMWRRL